MLLKDIIEFIDLKIPKSLALEWDSVGFVRQDADLNRNIERIIVVMDLIPELDCFGDDALIVAHHPPIFSPETAAYTVHSNWDIIEGGANEALCEVLNLEVEDVFDKNLNIGRVSLFDSEYGNLEKDIKRAFPDINIRAVNRPKENEKIGKIATVSGFGLKNPNYIQLANDENIDILISGDLTQESAILAKKLGVCLIDLGHHHSEIPGLEKLAELLSELDLPVETINRSPWDDLK